MPSSQPYSQTTALYVAISRGNIEMVKLLLIHGADPSRCAMVPVDRRLTQPDAIVGAAFICASTECLYERQISAIVESEVQWFPKLVNYYPRQMRQSLRFILQTLSKEHFPEDVTHFLIEYLFACNAL